MPVTLADWLARIEAAHPRGSDGIELGLERVSAVKAALNQVETFPVILVAGTNGKGSTCAMLEYIFSSAGYRVGLYTSPHLLHYNERIRVNLESAADDQICAAFARVEAARGDHALTYFEFGTLAAWEVFAGANLDVAILEVGLGGRLDATNVYVPSVSVVTTIDLDHMDFLGPDREAIGREKAGILRAGVPVVCGDPSPPLSLREHAELLCAPMFLMGRDFGYQQHDQQWMFWSQSAEGEQLRRGGLAHPGLRGKNQLANAATVLQVLELLRAQIPVAMKDIRHGLINVELAGRFQVLPGRPTIVLDVAHNPQAAATLAENLGNTGFHPRTWAVFGMLADKDIDRVIAAIKERVTHWLPCTLPGRRTASADFLAERLAASGCELVEPFENPVAALRYAQESAGEDDRILVFGSFLTVAEVLAALGRTV